MASLLPPLQGLSTVVQEPLPSAAWVTITLPTMGTVTPLSTGGRGLSLCLLLISCSRSCPNRPKGSPHLAELGGVGNSYCFIFLPGLDPLPQGMGLP